MTSQSSIHLLILTLVLGLASCSPVNDQITSLSTFTPTILPSQRIQQIPTNSVSSSPTPRTVAISSPLPTYTAIPLATITPTQPNVQSLPDPAGFTWQVIAKGLNQPIGLVSSPDGSSRLFVLEQAGVIRVFKNGEVLPAPFLDIRDRVSMKGSTTAGLLGLAFHPDYAENGYFYIHYSDSRGVSVIARYETTQDATQGDPASEMRLFEIRFPIGEHKGGNLVFGPDGYLYISIGDGGAAGYGDQEGNAQNPGTLLGSILRVDVDGGVPYAIPERNPFVSGGGLPEVWAYGLRNPWRFSFDRLTGGLYIPDVGENRLEEINFLPAGSPGGSNFGWSYMEGSAQYKGQPPEALDLIDPVAEYDHTQGCSITGGVVYRGKALPEWYGVYIYGDFCKGNIWGLLKKADGTWENMLMHRIQSFITSFGQDEDGETYLVDLTGEIFKLIRK